MGTGVILLGELGTGGEGWEEGLLKSLETKTWLLLCRTRPPFTAFLYIYIYLVRSTQELCPPGGVSWHTSWRKILIWRIPPEKWHISHIRGGSCGLGTRLGWSWEVVLFDFFWFFKIFWRSKKNFFFSFFAINPLFFGIFEICKSNKVSSHYGEVGEKKNFQNYFEKFWENYRGRWTGQKVDQHSKNWS